MRRRASIGCAKERAGGRWWGRIVGSWGISRLDDGGGSDIEVSELSECKYEEELLDGFENEGEEKEKEEKGMMVESQV
jgi:hypothetical protein